MPEPFKFGLIGHNIAYSKSAEVFNAIFKIKDIHGTFENFDLKPESFEQDFNSIIEQGNIGLSVTIPYKTRVIPLLNELDPAANALQAVNSIAVSGTKLIGYNTDTFGFALPLKPHAPDLNNGVALILGCGGSAKAGLYALHSEFGISRFIVLGRSLEKLTKFKNAFQKTITSSTIQTETFDKYFQFSAENYSIVVNCTPLGGWNHLADLPLPHNFDWSSSQFYYDLNYNSNNRIVQDALKNGLTVYDGSRMLVGQAVKSFEIWTGLQIDFESVYDKVFGAEKRKSMAD